MKLLKKGNSCRFGYYQEQWHLPASSVPQDSELAGWKRQEAKGMYIERGHRATMTPFMRANSSSVPSSHPLKQGTIRMVTRCF